MPIIDIHLMEGRTDDQKRKLVASVTKAVCESVDVDPQKVKIIISEMAPNGYAVGGKLKIDQHGK